MALNAETVKQSIKQFDDDKKNNASDKAIMKLIEVFPSNSDLVAVLLKVTTINKLYSTNILSPFAVAEHIVSHKEVGDKIKEGRLSAVDDIRHIKISGKEKNFYSFATKYCNWHNFKAFPIYDSYAEKSLRYFNCATSDLRIYNNLKESVDRFRTQNAITEFTYKEVDKFLWLYGRENLTKMRPDGAGKK